MPQKSQVFEKNYDYYLQKIGSLDLEKAARNVGGDYSDGELIVLFFDETIRVSGKGVLNHRGKRPHYAICIALFKYVLMNSPGLQKESEWTAYRQFKDAGPLVVYFANDVEKAIKRHFEGRATSLKKACGKLGGTDPGMDVSQDVAFRFQALPHAPVLLLFNDRDDEFPASCSVLFQKDLEKYLDMESVAILGQIFANKLIAMDKGD